MNNIKLEQRMEVDQVQTLAFCQWYWTFVNVLAVASSQGFCLANKMFALCLAYKTSALCLVNILVTQYLVKERSTLRLANKTPALCLAIRQHHLAS